MTALDIINLISGLSSLILSIIAIWLSLYFYSKGKDTEKDTSDSLSQIKQQTDSLQKLTGKWMDRLTRHATDSSSYDAVFAQLIEVIKITPAQQTNAFPQLQKSIEELTTEAISGYIGMHHYCAVANALAQDHLPKASDFDITSEAQNLIKALLDNSHGTFLYLDNLLGKLDSSRISSNPISSWYDATINVWRPLVKNSAEVFAQNP